MATNVNEEHLGRSLEELPGIDELHPPAKKREIRGWYAYDAAGASFFYGTIDLLSILVVDQAGVVAKTNWCDKEYNLTEGDPGFDECFEKFWAEDFENKGFCSGLKAFGESLGTYTECKAENGTWIADFDKEATLVRFMGFEVAHVAVYAQSVTIMLILQLITLLLFGSINDFGFYRKKNFVICNTIAGVGISVLFWGSSPEDYTFNCAMLIVIQVFLNFSGVAYNSWLPLLVRATPKVDEAIMDKSLSLDEKFLLKEKVFSNISTWGSVFGFVGGWVYLTFLFVLALATPLGNNDSLLTRVGSLCCGMFFLALSTFAAYRLYARPGPKVPEGKNVVTIGLKRIYGTVKLACKLPELLKFLGAFIIYSDGNATIGATVAVFASEELYMGTVDILIVLYEAIICYAVGAAVAIKLKNKFDLDPKKILLVNLFLIGLTPLYSIFALRNPLELYLIVPLYALNSGSLGAFSRSVFASMIPRGHEAEFFTLNQLTDKGTSFIGPLVVTTVATRTGSIRTSFVSLVAFFYVGALILMFFNQKKADAERKAFEDLELKRAGALAGSEESIIEAKEI
mmetsp:Transcript_3911/g.4513  ORF Transcript_3911/g.4513 Transcript_3911/m.4513 type:complete len:570 (+) Transcript_3911:161-1870(+)|eukprot:CAMPEP_0184065286 /NCGR_PEP_ID=MMETSP0957-20130417/2619_1 /TAXON_ID=627963 /ORGANISM="Aplanochytrium sp, Strain PBS07" /LENGTH=569 /DNA_ID=CAMNT_0026362953 /DNA_START=81 /DNA_END=1790 /DNA_ORIENTATION=+